MIQYFIARLGESHGPYTIEVLKDQNITQDTLIWYEGLGDWKRADDIEEIRMALFTPISVPENPPAKKPSFKYGLLILGLVLLFCGSLFLIVKYHSRSAAGGTNDLQQKENIEIQQIKDRTLYWNQCLVTKNYAELQKLYAQEVKYYLRTVPNLEVIQNKKYHLDKSPNFNQSITGEILVTRMGNNTIRVRFSKRTTLKSKMVELEAELIFIDEAGEWKIASEQDASTADLSDAPISDQDKSEFSTNTTEPEGNQGWRADMEHCNSAATEIVEVRNPITGRVWMDRNLGASRVATSSKDAAAYGDLYQWGRFGDGHQCRNSALSTAISNSNEPGHGNFILSSSNSNSDWRTTQNDKLWQGVNGINNPCPTGFRLPTESEWEAERRSWKSNDATGAFNSPLHLPLGGFRNYLNGSLLKVGLFGSYWSATISTTNARNMVFVSTTANLFNNNRDYGCSVRCIRD